MSSSPALSNGSYQVLFFWGVLGISIVIVACLLVCTPLGYPLKRHLLCLGHNSSKSSQFNTPELEAHAFEFCSPQTVGTPAPPYEWVLRITPPPPPTAHFPSTVAHIAPTLTHRFSDIPRVPSGHGLGIQVKEDLVKEKVVIETLEKEKLDDLHSGNGAPDCSERNQGVLVSKPVRISASRPLSAAEIGTVEVPKAMEEAEHPDRRDRYRAILLQSDERTRQELLKSMPEEDRVIALAL